MSKLFKFRCRCQGSAGDASMRCVSQTTRKSITCKTCDDNCKGNGRKLAKLRWVEKVLAGANTR